MACHGTSGPRRGRRDRATPRDLRSLSRRGFRLAIDVPKHSRGGPVGSRLVRSPGGLPCRRSANLRSRATARGAARSRMPNVLRGSRDPRARRCVDALQARSPIPRSRCGVRADRRDRRLADRQLACAVAFLSSHRARVVPTRPARERRGSSFDRCGALGARGRASASCLGAGIPRLHLPQRRAVQGDIRDDCGGGTQRPKHSFVRARRAPAGSPPAFLEPA